MDPGGFRILVSMFTRSFVCPEAEVLEGLDPGVLYPSVDPSMDEFRVGNAIRMWALVGGGSLWGWPGRCPFVSWLSFSPPAFWLPWVE